MLGAAGVRNRAARDEHRVSHRHGRRRNADTGGRVRARPDARPRRNPPAITAWQRRTDRGRGHARRSRAQRARGRTAVAARANAPGLRGDCRASVCAPVVLLRMVSATVAGNAPTECLCSRDGRANASRVERQRRNRGGERRTRGEVRRQALAASASVPGDRCRRRIDHVPAGLTARDLDHRVGDAAQQGFAAVAGHDAPPASAALSACALISASFSGVSQRNRARANPIAAR